LFAERQELQDGAAYTKNDLFQNGLAPFKTTALSATIIEKSLLMCNKLFINFS
jgi:hypothetical protein